MAAATFRAGEEVEPVARELRGAGVEVHLFGPAIGPTKWVRGLGRSLRPLVEKADVVHVHALWEEIQHHAAVEARRAGVRTVITPHGMLDPWSLSQGRWKKTLHMSLRLRGHLNRAAALHVTAAQEYEQVRPLRLTVPPLVESLGVDLSEFDPLPAKGFLRERFPEIGGRGIVLFLGRVHPKKGLDLLIPAFARAETGGAVLVVAGPAEEAYERELRGLVARHGLEGRVFFTGMLHGTERVRAYVDADLFVLPSHQENFGVSVAEALAAGVPVIVSDKVNICGLIEGAGIGQVVALDVADIARALSRWMGDADLRASASGKARAFARMHFDWAQIGGRWPGHYQRLSHVAGDGTAARLTRQAAASHP